MIELTDINEIVGAYDVYRHCMYLPAREKYLKKMDSFLCNDKVGMCACVCQEKISGMAVVEMSENRSAELLGISVDENVRGRRIGSYMVNEIMELSIIC